MSSDMILVYTLPGIAVLLCSMFGCVCVRMIRRQRRYQQSAPIQPMQPYPTVPVPMQPYPTMPVPMQPYIPVMQPSVPAFQASAPAFQASAPPMQPSAPPIEIPYQFTYATTYPNEHVVLTTIPLERRVQFHI